MFGIGAKLTEIGGQAFEGCWVGPNGVDNQCLNFSEMISGVLKQGASALELDLGDEAAELADKFENVFDNMSDKMSELVDGFRGSFNHATAGIQQLGQQFTLPGISITLETGPEPASEQKFDTSGPNNGPGMMG